MKRSDLSLGGHDRADFLPSEVVEVWGGEDWVQKQRDVGKANVTVGVLVPSDWGKRQPNLWQTDFGTYHEQTVMGMVGYMMA